MVGGSTSYTHKLITHFSLTLGSVCMSVSVGVRIRVPTCVCAWASRVRACVRMRTNKKQNSLFFDGIMI